MFYQVSENGVMVLFQGNADPNTITGLTPSSSTSGTCTEGSFIECASRPQMWNWNTSTSAWDQF